MFNEHTTSTQVSAHGSVTQDSHGSDNSAQVVTKVYGVEQGAPWVVHEVFVSDPQPLTPHPVLTFLKKPRGITNTFAFIYSLTRTIPPETDLLTRTPFRPAQRLQKAWLSSFHSQSPSQSTKASINLEIDEQKSCTIKRVAISKTKD